MLNEIEAIVRKAGKMITAATGFSVSEKEGHANFVTNMDIAVQKFLYEELMKLIPEASFIGEEQKNEKLPEGYAWVVDPIDGTTNFIHDYKLSAISVALMKNYQPVLACIFNPFADEMFCAEKGRGTTLNGKKITVSDRPMNQAVIAFGTAPYYEKLTVPTMQIAAECIRKACDVRRTGSAAIDLSSVACGRCEAFFELNLNPWDYAAGALLITEAGGCFVQPLLDQTDFDRSTVIFASNQKCYFPVKEILMNEIKNYPVD